MAQCITTINEGFKNELNYFRKFQGTYENPFIILRKKKLFELQSMSQNKISATNKELHL